MNLDVAETKRRLPLPELLARLGLGERAKKSARCPFHDDGKASFSVFQRDGKWFWKCHAGCGEGDEVDLLERYFSVSTKDAIAKYGELAGANGGSENKSAVAPPKPEQDLSAQWSECVAAFTDAHVSKLATWRGYSKPFCDWLKAQGLIGFFNGCIALAIRNESGAVVGIHYRQKDGTWRVHPVGCKMRPLIIGDAKTADVLLAFESQWDAFAVTDKLHPLPKQQAVIITRGASNGKLLRGLAKSGAAVYAFKQNDTAGEKWLADVTQNAGCSVRCVATPEPHKDCNEWLKAGATVKDLSGAIADAAEVEMETEPQRKIIVRNLNEFAVSAADNGGSLLGNRWLCRGGGLLLAAPTGIGKSSWVLQASIAWALGKPHFGIVPAGKLRALIIQAENDDGDVAEIRDGIFRGLALTDEEKSAACEAIKVVCESSATGLALVALVARLVAEHKPDLILIDPLFAYLGDSVTEQKAVSAFLRNGLNPILQEHGCGLILIHHTNKPKTGKEKPDWQAGDFAYLGAGTAELANWARAVLVIRSIGSHDVFEVILGKRGRRAGLVDAEGKPLYSFYIKHAAAGICWEAATEDDLPPDVGDGRHAIALRAVVKAAGDGIISYADLVTKLAEQHGVSDRTAKKAVSRARSEGAIYKTASGFYAATKANGEG